MESQKITNSDFAKARRWYQDACGTALAMDLIGERWSLLIVRELLLGPRRFGEIRGALEGLSANILTQRLEGLERISTDFDALLGGFQARRHDLLAFGSGDFDRDFVELTVAIDGLEVRVQDFIHAAFERVPSVAAAQDALARFGRVFVGDALETVHVVKYKHAEGSLVIFADDVATRHTTALAVLDHDTVAVRAAAAGG
jgi:hypothetical protein